MHGAIPFPERYGSVGNGLEASQRVPRTTTYGQQGRTSVDALRRRGDGRSRQDWASIRTRKLKLASFSSSACKVSIFFSLWIPSDRSALKLI